MRRRAQPRLASCPHCGETIRSDAAACPHCGSDDTTGWSQHTYLDGIDLPADDDYDDLVRQEFDTNNAARNRHAGRWLALVAGGLLLLALLGLTRWLW